MTKSELKILDRIMAKLGYDNEESVVKQLTENGGAQGLVAPDPERNQLYYYDEETELGFTFFRQAQDIETAVQIVVLELTEKAKEKGRWNLQHELRELLNAKYDG